MTVQQHFEQFHKSAFEHHTALAANETEKAQQHTALADAHDEMDQPALAKCHRKLAKACTSAAAEHTAHAGRHKEMIKTLGDSMSKLDLIPDHVSSVLPEFRAVTRAGQPQLPTKPNVPLEFEKLVSIEDD